MIGSLLGPGLASSGTSRLARGSRHSDRSPGREDAADGSRAGSVRSASVSSSADAAWRVSLLEESLAAAVAAAVAEAEERASRQRAEQDLWEKEQHAKARMQAHEEHLRNVLAAKQATEVGGEQGRQQAVPHAPNEPACARCQSSPRACVCP